MTTEHAIFVSAIEELKHFFVGQYQRVYFGNEVCHWLLPSTSQLRSLQRFSDQHGAALTFVSPVVSERGFDRVVRRLACLAAGSEVVINDWGLLATVRELDLVPVMGRHLVKIKRDPRITAHDLQDHELRNYLRSSNLSGAGFHRFLQAQGIGRVELDNVPQGYDLELPEWLQSSLYYPYVNLAVTKRCALAMSDDAFDRLSATGRCRERCQSVMTRTQTRSEAAGETLSSAYFTQGGSHFFTHDQPPADTKGWNLSRRVYMPRPPLSASKKDALVQGDWDAVYQKLGPAVIWNRDPQDKRLLALVERFGPAEPDRQTRALDLGCGSGRNARALASLGFGVTAMDRAAAALALLDPDDPGIQRLRGDALRLPLGDGRFALVMDYGCLHAIAPLGRSQYVEEVRRILEPGGHLFLFVRRSEPEAVADKPMFFAEGILPEWGFTLPQLQQLFAPDLTTVHSEIFAGQDTERFLYVVLRRC